MARLRVKLRRVKKIILYGKFTKKFGNIKRAAPGYLEVALTWTGRKKKLAN
jgi:hypothetical protein